MRKILHTLLVLLNILSVLALVVVKIGSVVSPNSALLPAYAPLGLQPLLFVNIAFVLFWLLFRKWWALLSLSFLLLFSGMARSAYPFNFSNKAPEEYSHKLKVLSYNTMNTGMMKKHTAEDPNKVVQYILDTDADIVCLQEFAVSDNSHQFQADDFERIFEKYPYKHVSFLLNKWQMNMGLATLSKYPIIEKRNIDYESDYNLSMFTDIVVGEDTLRVINNHLESTTVTTKDMEETAKLMSDFTSEKLTSVTKHLSKKMGAAYKIRAKQAEKVANVAESSPYKVILCGDFNDVPMILDTICSVIVSSSCLSRSAVSSANNKVC